MAIGSREKKKETNRTTNGAFVSLVVQTTDGCNDIFDDDVDDDDDDDDEYERNYDDDDDRGTILRKADFS